MWNWKCGHRQEATGVKSVNAFGTTSSESAEIPTETAFIRVSVGALEVGNERGLGRRSTRNGIFLSELFVVAHSLRCESGLWLSTTAGVCPVIVNDNVH